MSDQTVECNCLKEAEEKIKKYAAEKNTQKGYKVVEANWERKSLFPASRLYSNFIITHTFEKKDGTTSRPQHSTVAMFYTFCPFCGTKLKEI